MLVEKMIAGEIHRLSLVQEKFTCSKTIIGTLEKSEICSELTIKAAELHQ